MTIKNQSRRLLFAFRFSLFAFLFLTLMTILQPAARAQVAWEYKEPIGNPGTTTLVGARGIPVPKFVNDPYDETACDPGTSVAELQANCHFFNVEFAVGKCHNVYGANDLGDVCLEEWFPYPDLEDPVQLTLAQGRAKALNKWVLVNSDAANVSPSSPADFDTMPFLTGFVLNCGGGLPANTQCFHTPYDKDDPPANFQDIKAVLQFNSPMLDDPDLSVRNVNTNSFSPYALWRRTADTSEQAVIGNTEDLDLEGAFLYAYNFNWGGSIEVKDANFQPAIVVPGDTPTPITEDFNQPDPINFNNIDDVVVAPIAGTGGTELMKIYRTSATQSGFKERRIRMRVLGNREYRLQILFSNKISDEADFDVVIEHRDATGTARTDGILLREETCLFNRDLWRTNSADQNYPPPPYPPASPQYTPEDTPPMASFRTPFDHQYNGHCVAFAGKNRARQNVPPIDVLNPVITPYAAQHDIKTHPEAEWLVVLLKGMNNTNNSQAAAGITLEAIDRDRDGMADEREGYLAFGGNWYGPGCVNGIGAQFVNTGNHNNGFDGNCDGFADYIQANVVTDFNVQQNAVLFEVPDGLTLSASTSFTPKAPMGMGITPEQVLDGVNFTVSGVTQPDQVVVMRVRRAPNAPKATKYLKFTGPADNPEYNIPANDGPNGFTWDPITKTGACFFGDACTGGTPPTAPNEITIHFVDNKRGDSDPLPNVISDPGVFIGLDPATEPDGDLDGVPDGSDNCLTLANADQADADFDGIGNRCDADLNNDCIVNPIDLGLFRTVFFTTDQEADFNSDGIVNPVDLGIFRTRFFMPPGPSGFANVCSDG